MDTNPEIPVEDFEALMRVVRAAEELRLALNESDEVEVLGSDFELQLRALEDALGALELESGDWGSVKEDWLDDAPGG